MLKKYLALILLTSFLSFYSIYTMNLEHTTPETSQVQQPVIKQIQLKHVVPARALQLLHQLPIDQLPSIEIQESELNTITVTASAVHEDAAYLIQELVINYIDTREQAERPYSSSNDIPSQALHRIIAFITQHPTIKSNAPEFYNSSRLVMQPMLEMAEPRFKFIIQGYNNSSWAPKKNLDELFKKPYENLFHYYLDENNAVGREVTLVHTPKEQVVHLLHAFNICEKAKVSIIVREHANQIVIKGQQENVVEVENFIEKYLDTADVNEEQARIQALRCWPNSN